MAKPEMVRRGKIYSMDKRRPTVRAGASGSAVPGAAKKVVQKAGLAGKTEQESRKEALLPG